MGYGVDSKFKSSVRISLVVTFLFFAVFLFSFSMKIRTVHSTNTTSGTQANLTIWDGTDSGMPFAGKTKFIDDQVYFYANYTNKTSGAYINGTGIYCNVSFNISGTWTPSEEMDFNVTESIYQYNRTFSSALDYEWNVTCNDTSGNYDELNLMDVVSISSTNISSCQVLGVANKVYTQTADITPGSGTCINITAENVTFDCNGYLIYNNSLDSTGIYSDQYNTTIKNCNVSMAEEAGGIGIKLYNANSSYIFNNTLNDQGYGLILNMTRDARIENNRANSNNFTLGLTDYGYGIVLESCENNTVVNNTANYNSYEGIYLLLSHNNTVVNNTANSNIMRGFILNSAKNNTLANNTANSNDFGITLFLSSNNSIWGNSLNSNFNGITFSLASSYNRITQNYIFNCISVYDKCIGLYNSDYNVFSSNKISQGANQGVWISSSAGDSSHNVFRDTEMTGINGTSVVLEDEAGSQNMNNTFLNFTYNNETVESNSELIRKWYVDVNVTNYTGDPVENISVYFYNSSSALADYNQTQSSGLTPTFELTEYVNTGGAVSYWTNYTMNANDSTGTYQNHTGTVNFTTNILVYVNLTEADEIPPQIYDVTNGSVYAIQAYILWNTSEPANSTVMFGTNETNLTQNNGNSSLVYSHNVTAKWLTKNTTYYYNVSSCDAAGNCNVSGVYNFTTPECNSSWSYGSWSTCSGGQQSRTRTDLNKCEYPWTKTEKESCGSGPSPSPPGPAPPPGNVTTNITLIPGVGLRNNTKLQKAVERILDQANMSEEARENMLRLSASIASDITTTRWFIMTSNKSKIQTRMKYNGSGKVRNFMVFENVPKGFSQNASQVTVIALGAKIEVVEEDPSWIVTYPELDIGDEVTITYEVNGTRTSSLINDVVSEVYAVSLEEAETTGEPAALLTQVCTPGERRNYEGYLQECSEDGLEWITLETPGQFTQLTQFIDWLAGLTEPMRTLMKMVVKAIVLVSVAVSIGVAVAGTAGMLSRSIPEKTRVKLGYKLYRIRYRIKYKLKKAFKRGSG